MADEVSCHTSLWLRESENKTLVCGERLHISYDHPNLNTCLQEACRKGRDVTAFFRNDHCVIHVCPPDAQPREDSDGGWNIYKVLSVRISQPARNPYGYPQEPVVPPVQVPTTTTGIDEPAPGALENADPHSSLTIIYIVIPLVILVLVVIGAIACYIRHQKKKYKQKELKIEVKIGVANGLVVHHVESEGQVHFSEASGVSVQYPGSNQVSGASARYTGTYYEDDNCHNDTLEGMALAIPSAKNHHENDYVIAQDQNGKLAGQSSLCDDTMYLVPYSKEGQSEDLDHWLVNRPVPEPPVSNSKFVDDNLYSVPKSHVYQSVEEAKNLEQK